MHAIDTNIAVYAFVPDEKAPAAFALLEGATISVQVLNEFANVALRKLGYDFIVLRTRIAAIRSLVAAIEPIDERTHDLARAIAARYRTNFYDSLLLASAVFAECGTFYSEDLQHGLVIEDTLTIENPFR